MRHAREYYHRMIRINLEQLRNELKVFVDLIPPLITSYLEASNLLSLEEPVES